MKRHGATVRDAINPRRRPEPKVMFLTRSFNRGGAERQLVTLLLSLHKRGWNVSVACFYAGGPLQRELEVAGIPVLDLEKRGRWDVFVFIWRLARLIRTWRPTILHGYLPVPNLIALALQLVHPRMKVIWGIRASNVDPAPYDWLVRPVFWAERRFARFADSIIVNSQAGLDYHANRGFPRDKMSVVHNGIDTVRFQFDGAGRQRLRREWGMAPTTALVGLVGRLDPMKGHSVFFEAAAKLAARDARWCFVCIGDGEPVYKAALECQADALGLHDRLIWAGPCDDMAAAYSALDISVSSSSFGEGFPNVVAEAMACGRPCVVTKVGDSAAIVADTGVVVSPRDANSLASGLEVMRARLRKEGDNLRAAARQRVRDRYSVSALVERTVVIFKAALVPEARAESAQ